MGSSAASLYIHTYRSKPAYSAIAACLLLSHKQASKEAA